MHMDTGAEGSPRRITVIELEKEDMKFSAGHFTVFSREHRERLHGHDFSVYVALTAAVQEDGLAFDYRGYKDLVRTLCAEWNEVFLLPGHSPHVTLEDAGDRILVHHGGERIPFLKGDVLVLPVANVTVEELSRLLLRRILDSVPDEHRSRLHGVLVKVFSGPGQSASAGWERETRGEGGTG